MLSEIIQAAERVAKVARGASFIMARTLDPLMTVLPYKLATVTPPFVPIKSEPDNDWSRKISLSKDRHDVELRHHKQKLEALGANVAKLKGQFDSGLKDIHASIKQFANQARPSQPASSYNNKSSAAGTSRPTGSYSGLAASFTCYFCNENGHGQ